VSDGTQNNSAAPSITGGQTADVKNGAAPGEAQKPAAEVTKTDVAAAPAKEVAAADIDLKFPDGFKPNESAWGDFKKLGKEFGLDSAKAQKLADLFVSNTQAAEKARVEALEADTKALKDGWLAGLKADKTLAGERGDALEANMRVVHKAFLKFGDDETAAFLKETGLDHHPALARLFYRVGQALAEDSVGGTAGVGSGALASDDAILRSMYPRTPELFSKE
jgi:hypothetical protein